jgi:crotonobetainyl-CoA:carnitine CoA-transferase CaiB-like acyl-CoA transferase
VSFDGKTFALPGSPLRGSRPLVDPAGLAPRFGEHTDEVLARFGFDDGTG